MGQMKCVRERKLGRRDLNEAADLGQGGILLIVMESVRFLKYYSSMPINLKKTIFEHTLRSVSRVNVLCSNCIIMLF